MCTSITVVYKSGSKTQYHNLHEFLSGVNNTVPAEVYELQIHTRDGTYILYNKLEKE